MTQWRNRALSELSFRKFIAMNRRYLISFAAILHLSGCVETSCPRGTIEQDGRCVMDGDAGVDGGLTCAVSCGGATPYCDDTVGVCVACREDADCGGDTPACSPTTRTCVACASDAHCGGDTPACYATTASCVGCLTNAHCSGEKAVCETTTLTCVECLSNADCTDPAAGRCVTQARTCAPCQADADCAHLANTPICEEGSGRCVACTPDTEVARCAMNSCDEITFTCTSTRRRTLTDCEACRADSECPTNARCAWHPRLGEDELVCMYDAAKVACNTADSRPYTETYEVVTVDGETIDACGLALSSCGALDAYEGERPCLNDSTCGSGGHCLPTGRCSIFCTSEFGCSPLDTCNGHCGG